MTIRAVGSSAVSCATTMVTGVLAPGAYVCWKIPIEGVYEAAANAVKASASAAAHPRTVKRMDLFMAPSLVMSPAVLLLRREFGRRVVSRNTTALQAASYNRAMDARAIGVFDSGTGGLT